MIRLVSTPIEVEPLLASVESDTTGAVAIFLGRVRNHAEGRTVTGMMYEAYAPMAEKEMERIAHELRQRWPVEKISVVHRVGELSIGEVSVAIAVCSAHRQQAFEACKYAIDELKRRVPIWKKERFEDGSAWVEGVPPGSPPEPSQT
jgi:molybdopterin synthase catalytic subunit